MRKFLYKTNYLILHILLVVVFSSCKENQKLQETLKQGFLGNKTKVISSNNKGRLINPSEDDIQSQKNSITSCPEDSTLIGKAFPKGNSQWCAYKDKDGNDVKHGEFRVWHSNGNIKAIANYQDGELEGEYKEWHQNNKIKELSKYFRGKKHGKTIYKTVEGQISEETAYANDNKNGLSVRYYKNQKPQERGTYKDGLKFGIWEFYDTSGFLKEKSEFQNGVKHGKYARFSKDGSILVNGFYDKDQEIGHWIYYSNKGQKSSEGNLIAGKKHGKWVDYNNNLQPIRISYLDNGRKVDSYKVATANDGSLQKSFGNRDILGAEPPIKRSNRTINNHSNYQRSEKPTPLSKDNNWSSL